MHAATSLLEPTPAQLAAAAATSSFAPSVADVVVSWTAPVAAPVETDNDDGDDEDDTNPGQKKRHHGRYVPPTVEVASRVVADRQPSVHTQVFVAALRARVSSLVAVLVDQYDVLPDRAAVGVHMPRNTLLVQAARDPQRDRGVADLDGICARIAAEMPGEHFPDLLLVHPAASLEDMTYDASSENCIQFVHFRVVYGNARNAAVRQAQQAIQQQLAAALTAAQRDPEDDLVAVGELFGGAQNPMQ